MHLTSYIKLVLGWFNCHDFVGC